MRGWGAPRHSAALKDAKKAFLMSGGGSRRLEYEGHAHFRQRIVLSCLSRRAVRISAIRESADEPGLRDFEGGCMPPQPRIPPPCARRVGPRAPVPATVSPHPGSPPTPAPAPLTAHTAAASFLRLVDKLCNGALIDVSVTGTAVRGRAGTQHAPAAAHRRGR